MNYLFESFISPIENIANENRDIVLLLRQTTNYLTEDFAEIKEEVAGLRNNADELRDEVDKLIDDVRMLKWNPKLIIDILLKLNMNIEDIKKKIK